MMAEEAVRARLGRGLAALIGDVDDEAPAPDSRRQGQRKVPIEFLRRNARNPRSIFDDGQLDELATSIRERGIIQPIIVRAVRDLPDAFEIVAGERRWRAAQRAGLHEVPVVVVEADDKTALEIAIIENIQRSDLNALEEAKGYDALLSQHGYTQTDLAGTLGKSRSHVANTLRLLKLPAKVQAMLEGGELTAGHARALLTVDDPEGVARRIVEQGLNVRDVERIGQDKADAAGAAPQRRPRRAQDADTRALQDDLEDRLGLKVRIDARGEEGELRIAYRSLDQLDAVTRRLRAS